MRINKYEVIYFDRLDWNWKRLEVLSEDEKSIVSKVDEKLKPEFRKKLRSEEDSLEIKLIEILDLPVILVEKNY